MEERKEVYPHIAEIKAQGILFHQEMVDYFDFLNLSGFRRLHEYQMIKEANEWMELRHRYIKILNELMPDITTYEMPKRYIPEGWRRASRSEVNKNILQKAVQSALVSYGTWEKYVAKECGKAAAKMREYNCEVDAEYFSKLACCSMCEIEKLEKIMLRLNICDYDIVYILDCQKKMHKKYKKKIEKMKE